jgi:hypothetical protein
MYTPVTRFHCSLHTVNSFIASFVAENCENEQKWQDEWSKRWLTKYGKRKKEKKRMNLSMFASKRGEQKKWLLCLLWWARELICSHDKSIIAAEYWIIKSGMWSQSCWLSENSSFCCKELLLQDLINFFAFFYDSVLRNIECQNDFWIKIANALEETTFAS